MKKMLAMALALQMVAVLLPVTAMAEVTTVDVTPETAKTNSYGAISNVIYRLGKGDYGDFSAFLRSSENVTFIADEQATFSSVTIGYHAGQDTNLAAKHNHEWP